MNLKDIENIEEKRNERKKSSAEDFTPTPLVNEILDRLTLDSNNSVWEEEKTFIDPACGDGQFLVEVLKRKLEKGHDPVIALETIFGCDIMKDNIEICRLRLFYIIDNHITFNDISNSKKTLKKCIKILHRNIVHTSLDDYKNGSLDYLDDKNSENQFNDEISDDEIKNFQIEFKKAQKEIEKLEQDKKIQKEIKKSEPNKSFSNKSQKISKNHTQTKIEEKIPLTVDET